MKVLIVDSVKDERARLVEALYRSSEIVVVGAVGRLHTALHALGENPPDVIVTDCALGDDHAVHLIAAARRCVVPPAIVVWASNDTIDERRRCLEAGASRFVSRAAGIPTLERAVVDVHATHTRPSRQDQLALIGRLTAGVAHDLNNYLGVIDVSLALMKTEEAESVRKVVDSAIRLTSNLTRYARGSAPPFAPVDLGMVVTRVVDMFRRSLPESVDVVFLLETVPVIEGNDLELEQLVLNLLLNAAEASPENSKVTIRLHTPASGIVRLEVEDSGQGFAAIDASFSPSTKRPGIGLGLGIVRGVAGRHAAALRFLGNRVTVDFSAYGRRL